MKKILVVLVVLLVLVGAIGIVCVFADDTIATATTGPVTATSNASAINKNILRQTQRIKNEIIVNNEGSPPSLPQASAGVSGGIASTPLSGGYGHLITQMSIDHPSVGNCEKWTTDNLNNLVYVLDQTKGAQKWEDMNENIIPYPMIKQRFDSFSEDEPVFYFPAGRAAEVLSRLNDQHLVGSWAYNSKFEKEEPILAPYYKPRAQLDARLVGANVIISFDQFFQGYFLPESQEFSVGALFSSIASSFLHGASVGASAGVTSQQNTEFGRTGAAFIFLRVANAEELCRPPESPPQKIIEERIEAPPPCDPRPFDERIKQLKEAASHCPNNCFNNELLWKQIGDSYLDWYECGGKVDRDLLLQAAAAYERSEKNFLTGHEPDKKETKSLVGAQDLVYKARYNWAWCLRELHGQDVEIRHGQEKNLQNVPEFYRELKR